MYLKGFVTAAFGSSEPFYLENGRVLSAPSLHRESTDSLIGYSHCHGCACHHPLFFCKYTLFL